MIAAQLIGIAQNAIQGIGSATGRENELVLKLDSKYRFFFQSNNADNNISYLASWYEHSTKNAGD